MAFRSGLIPRDARGASTTAGLGCAPIGNLFASVAESDAVATVQRAFDRGVRFFDTAPHYGAGASEARLGAALAGVARDRYSIATKVGRRILDTDGEEVSVGATGAETIGDLTRDGILRSLEGSLARLGTDRVDLLYLHDPDDVDEALRTAMPTLVELREQGVVRAIGVGMVHVAPLLRFTHEAPIDVVMPAGRLTLLDRSADEELIPTARDRGIGVIGAGVFNSGILADPEGAPYFDYRLATDAQREQARAMAVACAVHAVPLRHVAARYPLRVPGVEAVVVGARTADEVDDFVDGLAVPLPEVVWNDVEAALTAVSPAHR